MFYSGVTGKIGIKIGTGDEMDVLHSSSFSVEMSRDIQEIISFGNSYKEKIPSVKDWTASLDGTADFVAGAGQKELYDAYENGTMVNCTFYLDSTTFLKGNAYIESVSVNHAADGKAEVSMSLSGNDAVALTVPSGEETNILGELDVTSAAGAATNGSVISVTPSIPASGNHYVYKLGAAYTAINYGGSVATWTTFTSGADIACGANTKITVCEATSGNLAVGRGIAVLVKHT